MMEAFCGVFGLVAFYALVIMLFAAVGKAVKAEKRNKELEGVVSGLQTVICDQKKEIGKLVNRIDKYNVLNSSGSCDIRVMKHEGAYYYSYGYRYGESFSYNVVGYRNGEFFIIRSFEYDPHSKKSEERAMLNADELAEAIRKSDEGRFINKNRVI